MHKQLNQIALGFVVNQNQRMNEEEKPDLMPFIDIIKGSFKPYDEWDETVVTLTTPELVEKFILASGKQFYTEDVILSMKEAGFHLKFIALSVVSPDFYWLLKPKI
jgi:hypothetical protein